MMRIFYLFIVFTAATLFWPIQAKDIDVDFNRDIRPILSDKCFHCHGPDAENQKSDFRIDTREHALEDLDGVRGVVPGSLDKSEVHWRIRLPNDDSDVMPPLDSNRVLTRREKDLIDAWIKQGAEYDIHWSFKTPKKGELPKSKDKNNEAWAKNGIDHFVVARLEEEGLKPSPQASLETRLRRAALSLTGLTPTPEMMDAALAEAPDVAYAKFVDQLLSSIDYAERQTLRWLDAARYADTDGYQNDSERKNWPWRDWVIKAFHDNMPFDQFTIEQLAGDMLPKATSDQILASAFNRNHRQNAEGGALAPEFFVENVIDRVETTSTVWLGLTMGCARCHDHKYDPLSQKEFFQLFAYFNNIGERGTGKGVQANPVQNFRSPLFEPPADLLASLESAMAAESAVKKSFNSRRDIWIAEATKALNSKTDSWKLQKLAKAGVKDAEGVLTAEEDGSWRFDGQNEARATYILDLAPGTSPTVSAIRLDALPDPSFGKPRQLARSVNGNFVLTDVNISIVNSATSKARPVKIGRAIASFEQTKYPISQAIDNNAKSGWAVSGTGVRPETVSAYFVPEAPIELVENEFIRIQLAHNSQFADHNIGRLKLYASDQAVVANQDGSTLPPKVTNALRTAPKRRSPAERKTLTEFFKTIDQPSTEARKAVVAAETKISKAGGASVPVMVMREREGERIPAYRLERGQYDAPDRSEELPRAVPAAFFQGKEEDQPQDRLELARWIVSAQNPLTARVIVNRVWQDHFGQGIVKTIEDFGAQSRLPSHPGLLDWLVVEFIESGWDLKALHRLIVTSATYQQSSRVSRELLAKDPENQLLARGPRYRMDGFAIRDLALRAAGLLDTRVGGPPVKPYQPDGLWNNLGGGANVRYNPGKGADLYRKSLYTYWKRAVNPPRQLIFDAGGREACNVAVRRTNTPLQALVLMNDVTFIEAARKVAEQVLKGAEQDTDIRLSEIYRKVTALEPDPEKTVIMKENLTFFLSHFESNSEQATDFLKAGESPRDESIPVAEHAAWTAVAHLVLNLDTSVTLQ